DMLLAGRRALVIGNGDVGKGSAQSLRKEGMIVRVSEVDLICAMQACMDGYELFSLYIIGKKTNLAEVINTLLLQDTDLIVTTTDNYHVCDKHMLAALNPGAVVCNICHFDTEIDTQFMRDNWNWVEIKPQVHQVYRSEDQGDYLILLAEGRLVNLGNATGHPSRVMDGSFANQVLAQMYLHEEKFSELPADERANGLYVKVLPKKLDEEVAAAMVAGFNGVMT